MLQRIVTGLVLAPLLVWLVLWAPKAAMLAVLVAAAARCGDELVRMFPEVRGRDRAVLAALSLAVAASPLSGMTAWALALPLALCGWLLACLVRPEDLPTAARRAAIGGLSLVYAVNLVAVLVALFRLDGQAPTAAFDSGRGALLGVFVVVFMGDTGAYFAGRAFGRHKLYELVSPKKTVEGGIGGLLSSVAGGAIVSRWLLPQVPLSHALLLGACCGVAGQIGDFAESLFKRATGTKDSGNLLPGHGGLLDRVDGVLFGAPLMLAYLQWAV